MSLLSVFWSKLPEFTSNTAALQRRKFYKLLLSEFAGIRGIWGKAAHTIEAYTPACLSSLDHSQPQPLKLEGYKSALLSSWTHKHTTITCVVI